MTLNVSRPTAVAGLACVLSLLGCKRVPWIGEREVCGVMRVVDNGRQTALGDVDLLVYRTESDNTPCCSKAEKTAHTKTDAEGHFKAGDLDPGHYFVVVEKSDLRFVIPVSLETRYDGKKCTLNSMYAFDRTTGKLEATTILFVNSPK
jgi:hypothetical protein